MKKLTTVTAAALALALSAGAASPAFAKPDHAGKGKPHAEKAMKHKGDNGKNDNDSTLEDLADSVLTNTEKALIGDYFSKEYNHVGAKPLPPGIAMNLKRGKPLPPGIAKRGTPDDLDELINTRDGVRAIIAGDNLVLEQIATGVIVDILRGVVR